MKTNLPHFVYLSVLLAGSFFYWRTQQHAHQLLDFVNRPSDQTYVALGQVNEQLKGQIEEYTDAYPTPHSLAVARRSQQADSLVRIPWNQHFGGAELRRQLAALDEYARTDKFLAACLSSDSFPGGSAYDVAFSEQNDSLRRQIALASVLSDLLNYVTGTGTIDRFDAFTPVASFTTLCAPVNQSTAMDIALTSYGAGSKGMRISVNGEALSVKEGVGHFQHTFPTTGIYPLQVDARLPNYNPGDDSIVSTKTFLLHVNQ